MKELLSKVVAGIESTLSLSVKVVIGFIVVGLAIAVPSLVLKDRSEITNSTVMITSMNERGGGSGSVIDSNDSSSSVLTNKHVCEVIANGGLVKTNQGGKHTIVSYVMSKRHDLCLIRVLAKLPGKVSLASKTPDMYEEATVSGHPALLPNVVTRGHFSGNKIIDVFMGLRECTEADMRDYELGSICMFFGGMPMLKTYEAVLVTATIMPGSSGSAIYNSSKELSAVVFAGSGEIGYAFAVPYEYVRNFINTEHMQLKSNSPDYNVDIKKALRESNKKRNKFKNLETKCTNGVKGITNRNVINQIEKMCETIIRDSKWRN